MWRDTLVAEIGTLQHPAWSEAHLRRVWGLAQQLVASEGISLDEDVLFAAIWLHDVGTFDRFSCLGESPPECAARAAQQVLQPAGFPLERIPAVVLIIREHSFEGVTRDTPEACVLRDADMLEFLGNVGLMRLLSLVGIEDWVADPAAAIDLAVSFSAELPAKMIFETSRVMAKVRADETARFVRDLAGETSGLDLL